MSWLPPGWNAADAALIALLCIAFPVVQVTNSLRNRQRRAGSARYWFTAAMIGAPLALLAADWRASGRSAAALGLAIPIPLMGEIGLAVAGALVLALFISSRRASGRSRDEMRAELNEAGLLIGSSGEFGAALFAGVVVGCGSEILFRGFLLWAFTPVMGMAGAVVAAALSYGLGHGFRNTKQALGSVASAFAFTIAYALSHSLWWLMLIHTAAAFFGAWSGYRFARTRTA